MRSNAGVTSLATSHGLSLHSRRFRLRSLERLSLLDSLGVQNMRILLALEL